MSGKGAHINVLGERIRRYYEHLMTDAHSFVDELRKDLEGPPRPEPSADQIGEPQGTRQTKPVTRSH
jgi:hypothetical protein